MRQASSPASSPSVCTAASTRVVERRIGAKPAVGIDGQAEDLADRGSLHQKLLARRQGRHQVSCCIVQSRDPHTAHDRAPSSPATASWDSSRDRPQQIGRRKVFNRLRGQGIAAFRLRQVFKASSTCPQPRMLNEAPGFIHHADLEAMRVVGRGRDAGRKQQGLRSVGATCTKSNTGAPAFGVSST